MAEITAGKGEEWIPEEGRWIVKILKSVHIANNKFNPNQEQVAITVLMKKTPSDTGREVTKYLKYNDKSKKSYVDLGSPVALLAAAIAGVEKFESKASWNDEAGFVDQTVYGNVGYFITNDGTKTWNFRDSYDESDGKKVVKARAFSPYTISEEEAGEIQAWFGKLFPDMKEKNDYTPVRDILDACDVPSNKKVRDLSDGQAKKVREALKVQAKIKKIELSA